MTFQADAPGDTYPASAHSRLSPGSLRPPTSCWSPRSPRSGSGPLCLHCPSIYLHCCRLLTERTEGGWMRTGSTALSVQALTWSHPPPWSVCVCARVCAHNNVCSVRGLRRESILAVLHGSPSFIRSFIHLFIQHLDYTSQSLGLGGEISTSLWPKGQS